MTTIDPGNGDDPSRQKMGASGGSIDLKLLVDTEHNVVLFAEAGKEFVDFLFHILALPVGTVTQLLGGEDMVGSVGNLFSSVENINAKYMESSLKTKLLNPKPPGCASQNLLSLPAAPSSTSAATVVYYKCSSGHGGCSRYVTDSHGIECPSCGIYSMTSPVTTPPPVAVQAGSTEGGYVRDVVTYMVLDDLTVKPMSTISCFSQVKRNMLNVKDLGVIEEKEINVGLNEAVKLLKASLQSKAVLTDAFLGNKEVRWYIIYDCIRGRFQKLVRYI